MNEDKKVDDEVYIPSKAFVDLCHAIGKFGDKRCVAALNLIVSKLNDGGYGNIIVSTKFSVTLEKTEEKV